jgi:hypothetical protein
MQPQNASNVRVAFAARKRSVEDENENSSSSSAEVTSGEANTAADDANAVKLNFRQPLPMVRQPPIGLNASKFFWLFNFYC